MIGHSIGEYAAAAIAGVMSLEDAAMLVVQRGKLLQAQAAGGMLSVRAAAEQIEALLQNGVCLAAENGPTACVVAGPRQHLEAFAEVLAKSEIVSKPLHTSHAFHSAMMDPAVPVFRQCVAAVKLSAPRIPMVSSVTGKLLGDEQAVSPDYWASHLRLPVRFSPAIKSAIAEVEAVRRSVCLLEIGPRASLAALLRQHVGRDAGHSVLSSSADEPRKEQLAFAAATASLWTMGIELTDTNSRAARRVLLPTYPFERKRFWLEARPVGPNSTAMPPAVDALPIPIGPSVLFAPHATTEFALPESAFSSSTLSSVLEHSAMSTIQLSASRKASLVEKIRALFEEVSGQDLASASPEASFLELGLDSLTLTQAAIQVKKSFKQNITFRQLMEQFRSMGSLADHMDTVLPPEPVTTPIAVGNPASAAVASPVTTMAPLQAMAPMPVSMPVAMSVPVGAMPPQGASGNMLQSLIQQQMHLMSQQLALLSGHAAAGMMPTVAQGSVVAASVAPAAMVPTAQPVPTAQVNAAQDTETESKAPQKYDVKKAFGAIARIHTTGNALTDRQLARLDAFVRRYTEKTAKSKEYTVAHRAHLADPRVVNNFRPQTKEIIYQIVMEKSKGSHLWDLDGNKYVDALNGFGMSLFGWRPDFIEEAIRAQHEAGYDVGPMSPLAGEVAKLVCELTGFDRAGFCNTGSEAVMAAIRIARTVTGRSLMVVFAGSYHGTFDEVIVRAGRNNKGIPAAPGIMSEAFGNVLVLEYGTPETLEIIRQHADELAAVLVEPVQSRRADFQPKEFLRDVRAITEKSGTCLIFDEVITGFRSHPGGVQSLFGIRADLGTYGKVVGGGYPIGVIAGKREFMDALDGGAWQYGDDSIPTVGVTYFAGTFVRHPLALAAAKASLLHMKEVGPDLQAGLNLRTAAMADELNAFCAEVGAPITIKNFASLWRTTFTEDHPLQDLLFAMMRSRGVHILDNFPCFFTTAHTPEDVAVIKTAFKESVLELQEADLLPRRNPEAGKVLDASKPPVPGARIGKDPEGNPAWFVPNPASPGKFLRLDA
jgi:glutamate-1-semialdehyde aminotransferase/malonyl CoA-acyl carrier protein transacylase